MVVIGVALVAVVESWARACSSVVVAVVELELTMLCGDDDGFMFSRVCVCCSCYVSVAAVVICSCSDVR